MYEAKTNSSMNAVRHGVFAKIVLNGRTFGREAELYDELLTVLKDAVKPTNGLEEILVQKLAFLFLRLSRVYKADRAIAPRIFTRVLRTLTGDRRETETIDVDKKNEIVLVSKEPSPDLVVRYEANIERQIARTLDQLMRLTQTRRGFGEASDANIGHR